MTLSKLWALAAAFLMTHAMAAEPARLERLRAFMQAETAKDDYLGAVVLVVRADQPLAWDAYGWRDLTHHQRMRRDDIFRIYSMTKAVTAVAVLSLMEEGKLLLDDPVGNYLPAFAHMRVATAGGTRAAAGPVTIRQLLSHTAGFATYLPPDAPLTRQLEAADLGHARDLADYTERLARLPLGHDPGREFHYDGVPLQVAARIVEVVAGMPFDRFLQARIFTPLRMTDTGFEVEPAKRGRIAEMTTSDAAGKLAAVAPGTVAPAGARMNPYFSGAGGLYSTAADYGRFALMLLHGGALDGERVLGRKSVELMMTNQLSHLNPPSSDAAGAEGFGLGGAVLLDVARSGRLGSVGAFRWSGAGGTYFTVDPKEGLVAILLTQHLPQGLPHDPPKLANRFYNLVYQALGD